MVLSAQGIFKSTLHFALNFNTRKTNSTVGTRRVLYVASSMCGKERECWSRQRGRETMDCTLGAAQRMEKLGLRHNCSHPSQRKPMSGDLQEFCGARCSGPLILESSVRSLAHAIYQANPNAMEALPTTFPLKVQCHLPQGHS